jgi:hypothetical protein
MLFHLAPFVSLAGPLDGANGGPLAWVDDQTTYNFTTSPEYGDSSYPLAYNELWSPQWQHFVSFFDEVYYYEKSCMRSCSTQGLSGAETPRAGGRAPKRGKRQPAHLFRASADVTSYGAMSLSRKRAMTTGLNLAGQPRPYPPCHWCVGRSLGLEPSRPRVPGPGCRVSGF